MKLNVNLSNSDVEYLDAYARAHGHRSRSAALHQAVRTLRVMELGGCYEDAWKTWESDGEALAWEPAARPVGPLR